MAVYPDKNAQGKLTGRYRVEVQLNGHRKRGRFDTLTEARSAERQWHEDLASGLTSGTTTRPEHVTPMTLGQLAAKASPMLWNGSMHGRMSRVKIEWIVSTLGDTSLSKINSAYVDSVVCALREAGKAPATVNRYLSALRSVLDWGSKRDHIAKIPEFDWQEEDEGRLRYLSRDEERGMIAALRSFGCHAVADYVIAAIDTGCRRSELLHAKPDQLEVVDRKAAWLRLWKTKNGTARSVPVSDRAYGVLSVRLPWQLTEAQLRYAWDKAKAQIGLANDDGFVVHALRHTCATRLVEQGVNLRVVQQFMGHLDIKTTLRYAHVSDDTLAATVAGIDLANSSRTLST